MDRNTWDRIGVVLLEALQKTRATRLAVSDPLLRVRGSVVDLLAGIPHNRGVHPRPGCNCGDIPDSAPDAGPAVSLTRREAFRHVAGISGTLVLTRAVRARGQNPPKITPALSLFRYGQVRLAPGRLQRQLDGAHQVLLNLDEDDLLRPFRIREGLPAPGRDLGGWYDTYAFAPGATYGQWLSALARYYAVTADKATRAKVQRMVRGFAATVEPAGKFYLENRFPSYIYDKLVCGLIDAHAYAEDEAALAVLAKATDAALPHLPPKATARQETPVLAHEDFTRHCWDESYTLPENLFLAARLSGDDRYLKLGKRFLYDEFFDALAAGENALPGKHAYSHVNALSSAAQAYLTLGDEKYFRAARNGFRMVQEQSYATGGWGPDEHFIVAESGKLGASLESTHSSFETPCGSYAHFKITRYLLRMTKDSRYGDSMERVLYNTVLGARPIRSDGAAFYYSDYNFHGSKFYFTDKWPCCSGTLPQVAADFGISAYLKSERGVYANLYTPSTLTWSEAGARCSLRLTTEYPYNSSIRFDITTTEARVFSVFLRIPEWAAGASVSMGGTGGFRKVQPGTFAEIRREWKSGDDLELSLPRSKRLEPIDAQHPDTVALLCGPLVLMPIGDSRPALTRSKLLSVSQSEAGARLWKTQDRQVSFKSFMDIEEERYSAYSRV